MSAFVFLTVVGSISALVFYGFGWAVVIHGIQGAMGSGVLAVACVFALGFFVNSFVADLRRVRVEIDSVSRVCRIVRFRSDQKISLSEITELSLKVESDGRGSLVSFVLRTRKVNLLRDAERA